MRPRSPEPKGKLDAMTGYSFSTPVWDGRTWVRPAVAEVAVARTANGPEDRPREQDAAAVPAPPAPASRSCPTWRVRLAPGAGPGGAGTAAAAADLQGVAGAGLGQGPEPAEADAAEQVEHAGQRAAGDAAQCRAQNPGDRRGGRVDFRSQGGYRGASAPVGFVVAAPRGQARVHTESR